VDVRADGSTVVPAGIESGRVMLKTSGRLER
jgi:hypothetical protein